MRTSTVTLITGDQVTVTRDGRGVTVEPGPGREDFRFHNRSDGERVYVIPSDAYELVAAGSLDRRLFDVTGLIEHGYDDAQRGDLPLILSYVDRADRAAAQQDLANAAVRTTRSLSSIDGAAVALDKVEADQGWAALRSAVDSNEVEHVWLDGRRKALLDESVPQIGAPEAWDAGYTGKGGKVAVLDTGIDSEQPDLGDAVVATKDFTGGASGTRDKHGHGTHVASIITGSGTGSGGRYAGVAPEAELVVGKVLGDDGYGTESEIIAGMEWAAKTKHVDAVSMSLGGLDEGGQDPMERAVDDLTEETGTLFVIAAGNDGPSPESISSPASASASLAVGAVTKQGRVAEFSSRGPTFGAHRIKPDATAPGVNIVAAKAKGTQLGEPVSEHYTSASGTSMATPHVAGAAALLAQQHEDWTADEMKAALMASAKPAPTLRPYDQGAGRVDPATAFGQTVVSDPVSIQFGVQRWPHDDDKPVRKTLTYRNLGDEPVELDLRAELTTPNGEPAPDDAIQLSADTVSVPAGKTASVAVSSDTSHDGPDGRYGGWVVASTGSQQVTTPIAVEREVESYDLTLKTIGPDGEVAPAAGFVSMVRGSHHAEADLYDKDGEATVRLPKDDYLLEAEIHEGKNSYLLAQPTVRLNKDVTITADARTAKSISTTVQREGAEPDYVEAGYFRERHGPSLGYQSAISHGAGFDHVFTAQLGPSEHVKGMTGYVASQWARKRADGRIRNSPYTYSLFDTVPGQIPTGYHRNVSNRDLAALTTTRNAQQPNQNAVVVQFVRPEWLHVATSVPFGYDLPSDATHYVDGGNVGVQLYLELYANGPDPVGVYSAPPRTYPIGTTIEQRWNAAPFAPWPKGDEEIYAERVGDQLAVAVPTYVDADGHVGGSDVDKASTTLTRNGEPITNSAYPTFIEANVPPGDAEYELRSTADRSSESNFSTKTKASWTFRSGTAGDDGTVLPIWGVRFAPDVDRYNVQHDSDGISTLPIRFAAPAGYENERITEAKLEVSTDDGETWRTAELTPDGQNAYVAQVRTPHDAAYVSLRTTAIDANGNDSSLKVIRAYGITR